MIEIIPIVAVVFLMVIAVSAKSKDGKARPQPAKDNKPLSRNAIERQKPVVKKTAGQTKTTKEKSSGMAAFRNIENRDNDWLAQQLREEKQKEKLYSEMYGMKKRHEANCAAEKLRREHQDNCDADSVDDGRIR